MRKPIPLRPDHDALGLRRLARASEDADQVRRLLALALIYDGGSRTQAAEAGGVTLQVVRDWVVRFNADGPGGLIDRKAPGQPSLGEAGQPTLGTIGPAHRLDLHLRRHLPPRRQGRRSDPALVQHGDDGPASRGDLRRCRFGPSRNAAGGPSWLASLRQARRAGQRHDRAAATQVP